MYNNFVIPQRYDIIHVNGRNGAASLSMAPNSQTLCLDESEPIVWLCQTDGAGYKTCTAFDVTPHQETKPEDVLKTLEDRIKALEERLHESNNEHVKTTE